MSIVLILPRSPCIVRIFDDATQMNFIQTPRKKPKRTFPSTGLILSSVNTSRETTGSICDQMLIYWSVLDIGYSRLYSHFYTEIQICMVFQNDVLLLYCTIGWCVRDVHNQHWQPAMLAWTLLYRPLFSQKCQRWRTIRTHFGIQDIYLYYHILYMNGCQRPGLSNLPNIWYLFLSIWTPFLKIIQESQNFETILEYNEWIKIYYVL